MKIYDVSQSRRVAAKLQEFVEAAQAIVQKEIDKIPLAKRMEIAEKLLNAKNVGGVKVDVTHLMTPKDQEINKLISKHMFHHSILEDIERYRAGMAMRDVLARPDQNLLKILGDDLGEDCSLCFFRVKVLKKFLQKKNQQKL